MRSLKSKRVELGGNTFSPPTLAVRVDLARQQRRLTVNILIVSKFRESTMYLRMLVVYFWILLLSFFVFALHACESQPAFLKPSSPAWSQEFDQGGGAGSLLHLPFPAGTASLCTQGAGGKYSHHGPSPAYDLDFDTSNTADKELYAPVSGTARAHSVTQTGSGFGNHLNIDRGDGTYVVIGHMKTIFVCDGCEVAAGQLIGYEG